MLCHIRSQEEYASSNGVCKPPPEVPTDFDWSIRATTHSHLPEVDAPNDMFALQNVDWPTIQQSIAAKMIPCGLCFEGLWSLHPLPHRLKERTPTGHPVYVTEPSLTRLMRLQCPQQGRLHPVTETPERCGRQDQCSRHQNCKNPAGAVTTPVLGPTPSNASLPSFGDSKNDPPHRRSPPLCQQQPCCEDVVEETPQTSEISAGKAGGGPGIARRYHLSRSLMCVPTPPHRPRARLPS